MLRLAIVDDHKIVRAGFREMLADELGVRVEFEAASGEEALQKLQALRDQAGLPVVGTRLLVLHGDPTYRIIEQEQECDCDLVVMGKHGEGMLEELFLGSVTKHVLAESQGDVLVSV